MYHVTLTKKLPARLLDPLYFANLSRQLKRSLSLATKFHCIFSSFLFDGDDSLIWQQSTKGVDLVFRMVWVVKLPEKYFVTYGWLWNFHKLGSKNTQTKNSSK